MSGWSSVRDQLMERLKRSRPGKGRHEQLALEARSARQITNGRVRARAGATKNQEKPLERLAFRGFPPYLPSQHKPLQEDPLAKEELLEFEGIVEGALPVATFRVLIANEHIIITISPVRCGIRTRVLTGVTR